MIARHAFRQDWTAIGCRVDDHVAEKAQHFVACATCGQAFDMRDLSAIAHHEIVGHAPLPVGRSRRLALVSRDLDQLLSAKPDR